MFKKFTRLINYIKLKSENNYTKKNSNFFSKVEFPESLNLVEIKLKERFNNCNDFIMRKIMLNNGQRALVCYIDGLVNNQYINEDILKPLMTEWKSNDPESIVHCENILEYLQERVLYSVGLKDLSDFEESVQFILSGRSLIYIDGVNFAIKIDVQGTKSRGIEEPLTEAVVRGPREGFNENLKTNTSLLRKKIKNSNLKFESMILGEETKTDVCIGYIEGIANEEVIKKVRNRLKDINVDAILESGYIEEFISDNPYSLFPTVGNSERPDKVAAKLLEGRVAIITDGTPFVLTVPYLFIESFQSSEDYYSKPYFSSLIRILRLISFIISITLPGLYVAFIVHHPQSIPFKLLISMASSREGIPFPPVLEAFIMLVAFELLREAGVRMPRPVGQAVSIVGALVLGEAAVQAGIASNLMIIVTALTAICTFIVPALGGVAPVLRAFILISGNFLGFMGIFLATIILLTHLFRQRSFGVLYMEPFTSLDVRSYKDTFVRVPLWMMFKRPPYLINNKSSKAKYRMKVSFRKKR